MSFEVEKPIDPEKFNAWIGVLLQDKGADLLRTKGILHYAGEDQPVRVPGGAHDRGRGFHRSGESRASRRPAGWCSSAAT